jgi:hypothetical protein
MLDRIKRNVIKVVAIALFAVPVIAPAATYAATAPSDQVNLSNNLCNGANLEFGGTCDTSNDTSNSSDKLNKILTASINILSLVVGVISVVMIIVGGLKYIMSGGDSGNVTGAKNTILYAVVGLVIVALAQFIVRFVLTKVSSATS